MPTSRAMANLVSQSLTDSSTVTPSCQCSKRTAHCRRRRRRQSGSASSPCSASPTSSASHSGRPATMSLRAGIMTVLVAGAAVAQPQPDLWQQPAAVIDVATAAPASAPTIPSWTAEVEQHLPRAPVDLHAPVTVTHFTRQLDLVERDPNAELQVRDTMATRHGSAAAVAARRPAEASSASSSSSGSGDSSSSSTSSSSASSSTSTSTSSESAPSPLPSPFDDAPSSIFKSTTSTTDACPAFMKKLLDDPTFKKCYPLSMMLRVCFSLAFPCPIFFIP